MAISFSFSRMRTAEHTDLRLREEKSYRLPYNPAVNKEAL
jgi:hypothetical protein